MKVAVTSRSFSENPILREELSRLYPQVTFNQTGKTMQGKELVAFLQGHSSAIVALEKIDESLLKFLPELKIISKYGVGLNNLDMEALRAHGIKLAWKGGVNRRSVAELALLFTLGLLHRAFEANRWANKGEWQTLKGWNLSGRTFGIIGLGHVGQDLVKLLHPFGCKILAHDIVSRSAFCGEFGVREATREEVFRESDIISFHIPLDESTYHYMGKKEFGLLKEGALVINTARGGIIDEKELIHHLVTGKLGGVGLDVFEVEPPPFHLPEFRTLLDHPRFFCTSHMGGSTEESILAMGRAAIEGLSTAQEARFF